VEEFAESCDALAGVINVAGVQLAAPSSRLDLADLRHVDVNLVAAIRAVQLAFPLLCGRS
jgi:hypothetical protein